MLEHPGAGEEPDTDRGDLRSSVVEVLDPEGNCAGTGFLLEEGLVVSCAHVVASGRPDNSPPSGLITVRFAHLRPRGAAAIPQWWHSTDEGDVAFLRLIDPPPEPALPLRLAEHAISERRVKAFGFPLNAPAGGQYGYGIVGDALTSDTGQRLLQLREATEITEGFSGAPVMDERTGLVVGMIDSVAAPDRLLRGVATAYITPAERLRAFCPQLPEAGPAPTGASPTSQPGTAAGSSAGSGRSN